MENFGSCKRTVVYLWIVLIFSIAGTYLYFRGAYDGAERYKHSRKMYLALKSAYHFGYVDCEEGRPNSWDGTEQK